jgi:hypothetical protein
MATVKDDKKINIRASINRLGAWLDAKDKNAEAIRTYPDFVTKSDHLDKINRVKQILERFFNDPDIYINHRINRGRPFTAIKVNHPYFNSERQRTARTELRAPIDRIAGTERVSTDQGYIVRIALN